MEDGEWLGGNVKLITFCHYHTALLAHLLPLAATNNVSPCHWVPARRSLIAFRERSAGISRDQQSKSALTVPLAANGAVFALPSPAPMLSKGRERAIPKITYANMCYTLSILYEGKCNRGIGEDKYHQRGKGWRRPLKLRKDFANVSDVESRFIYHCNSYILGIVREVGSAAEDIERTFE